MLATIIFEVGSILYVLWRYKMSPIVRLVVFLIGLLATFQLAEYMVCEGTGLNTVQWARVGYMAIILLPPAGIHLVTKLANKDCKWLVWASYACAVPFLIFFALAHSPFNGQQCLGNYVIFEVPNLVTSWLSIFYYSLLALAFVLALYWARLAAKRQKDALHLFTIGYVLFLLPTFTIAQLRPETIHGLPSIMCGFAVLLAITLVFGVLPRVDKVEHKRNN